MPLSRSTVLLLVVVGLGLAGGRPASRAVKRLERDGVTPIPNLVMKADGRALVLEGDFPTATVYRFAVI